MPLPDKLEDINGSVEGIQYDRYVCTELLGTGTFGRVYSAYDSRLPMGEASFKALKVLLLPPLDQTDGIGSVVKEAAVLVSIHHPHVVNLQNAFLCDNHLCLVMDLCQGGTLAEEIRRKREKHESFSDGQIACWTSQLADALSYVHSKLIIHRDLKSANIFLNHSSNNDQQWLNLKIGDFGVSRLLYNSTEKIDTMIGTPLNISPEVFLQTGYDRKIDIWALGCLLYEMCHLQHPFADAANLMELMGRIARQAVQETEWPASMSQWRDLCLEMLSNEPDRRPDAEKVLCSKRLIGHIKTHSGCHQYAATMLGEIPEATERSDATL